MFVFHMKCKTSSTGILMNDLQIIGNMDPSFPECSHQQVLDVIELLDICLKTTYFQFEEKFFRHKEDMTMWNSCSGG
jgi:hypothetical protein